MILKKKRVYGLAVMGMCLLSVLSLFGCGKKSRFVVDGPGMERQLWREFTISQVSDVYEQNFSYTVKYDNGTGEAYLYTEVPHETKGYPVEKSIALKEKTTNALVAMDFLSLPNQESFAQDEMVLDGTFLSFSVTDQDGTVWKKTTTKEMNAKILELITPYANKLTEN